MNAVSNCASHLERADIYSSKRMLPHFKEYVLFNEQVPFRHNKSIQFPNYVKQSCRSIADMEHHVQMPLVMQLISLDTWQMPTKRKPQKPKDTQQKWVKVLSQSVGDIGLFFFVFVKVCQMAGKVWQMKIGILWAQQVTTCIYC